jgi:DNA end-binding protein Ku
MAARAIGTATLSFGLVSIPVKVYSTTVSDGDHHFNLLERKTGSRLKQQYISQQTGEVVGRDEMVKGYEFAKGQYVVFTDEEMKAVEEKANKAVEIREFVPLGKVDPILYDKAYYLGPDKGAERPYALLREAMRKTGRAAVAQYAARGKQYLVLVRPEDKGLVMQQLHYAHEIRAMDDVPLGETKVADAELKLATQLVEQIASEEFHPESYKDEVRERIEEAIRRKVEGQEVTAEPAAEPAAKIIDLMEALKASLGEGGKAAARKPAKRAPRAAKKKAAGG